MPYTPEMFSRYNSRMEESRNAVCRHIQYLLKPGDGYPKGSDARLKELYNIWRADCRAMDAACEENVHLAARHEMIEMPPDDEEHFLCRRMAAVVIERYIFGQHNAEYYLPELVEQMKLSNCWKHSYTCACHFHIRDSGWTYKNYDLLCTLSASYEEKQSELERQERLARLAQASVGGGPLSLEPSEGGGPSEGSGPRNQAACSCGGCEYGQCNAEVRPVPPALPKAIPLRRTDEHVDECACNACYKKRIENGTQEAYLAKLRAETDAVLARMSGRYTRPMTEPPCDDLVKNLFKTVQGVNYDDKCPHGLPFYACMSCSH